MMYGKTRRVISVAEFVQAVCSEHRCYCDDGKWYIFRDKQVGDKRFQCQYGVLINTKDDGSMAWIDCEEGALFSQVAPLVAPEFDKIAVWLPALDR